MDGFSIGCGSSLPDISKASGSSLDPVNCSIKASLQVLETPGQAHLVDVQRHFVNLFLALEFANLRLSCMPNFILIKEARHLRQ